LIHRRKAGPNPSTITIHNIDVAIGDSDNTSIGAGVGNAIDRDRLLGHRFCSDQGETKSGAEKNIFFMYGILFLVLVDQAHSLGFFSIEKRGWITHDQHRLGESTWLAKAV
jgi:hypothetical protein